ncbi:MAG: radical SAM protein [Nitrospira sp.]|nr:radical SAM protein [bacterium]MBL7047996.1 radical SAM protein [Nitrospira sp.]
MGKITFVFPRFKYAAGDFSLGLAHLSAYLKREIPGIEVGLIDATFHHEMKYVSEQLLLQQPDIVGIYMDTLMYDDALKVAEAAKEQGALVVVGGPHASILPEGVMLNEAIDIVCVGEGEETLTEIVNEYYKDRDFSGIKGIWYKKDGKSVDNGPRPPIQDIDSLPSPDYELFETEKYISSFIQLDSYCPTFRGLSVIVSRGCPFKCSYCQPTLNRVHGKKFRIMSPAKVVDELKMLREKYAIDAVYFQDDTLTVSKKWMLEFCELMIKAQTGLFWACNTRADVVDKEMLEKMREAGLVKVKVGIESITDRIRNGIYQKQITEEQINNLINTATSLHIQVAGFFMIGAPTETEQEVKSTIRFAARSNLMEANFSVTVPLPETSLYKTAIEKHWLVPEKFSDYDYYTALRQPMATGDLSPKRLERYKTKAYLLFYLHPKRILNTLRIVTAAGTFKKTLQKLKRL